MAKRKSAVKTPKKVQSMLSVKFKCGDNEFDLPMEQVYFTGMEQSCDMCGCHGSVSVCFNCPHCNREHRLELNSW